MNKSIFLLFLTIIVLSQACEYEPSGSNFEELTPPEDYIPIEILLNGVNPSDTIFVYRNTAISLIINSPNDIIQAALLLDGQGFASIQSSTFNFIINPGQLSEGVHKLTVVAAFTSGTGSLAEMLGLEGYIGELSWNICVIHNLPDLFKLGYRINEKGFMEIFWEDTAPESIIDKYTIHSPYTQNSDTTIYDAARKYFVDYGYVCGNAYYQVTFWMKGGYSFFKRLSFTKPTPVLSFENLGPDNLRVCWDKPFANGRYNLIVDNITIAAGIHDTTITIPQYFGKTRQFTLEIRPQNPGYDINDNKFSASGLFCQGTSLGLPNWELYAYNRKDNILYTRKYDNLVAFDAGTMQQKNTILIQGNPWGFSYGGKIASAPHNSTVAAMTAEETWVFTDSRFINPIIIPQLPGNIHTRLSALTSDDRFFVVQGGTNICQVFNTLTGEKIFEIPFTYNTIYDIPDFVTVSEDGRFFCASSENGIEVFEIKGTATDLLYTDTREYGGAMFVPSQPDKLLLRVDSGIEIHQMPGFDLIQALDVSANGATLCNIDPVSMSLLYYQTDSLKVCRIDNLSETIFKIRSNEKACKMFNNKLLTYGHGGIFFDINPYLSH
jgi:hypothetical protein